MKKVLKDHFIPHEDNDHKPHFLRFSSVAKFLGAVLIIELLFLGLICNLFILGSNFTPSYFEDLSELRSSFTQKNIKRYRGTKIWYKK